MNFLNFDLSMSFVTKNSCRNMSRLSQIVEDGSGQFPPDQFTLEQRRKGASLSHFFTVSRFQGFIQLNFSVHGENDFKSKFKANDANERKFCPAISHKSINSFNLNIQTQYFNGVTFRSIVA